LKHTSQQKRSLDVILVVLYTIDIRPIKRASDFDRVERHGHEASWFIVLKLAIAGVTTCKQRALWSSSSFHHRSED
jgi:hypothetical protein